MGNMKFIAQKFSLRRLCLDKTVEYGFFQNTKCLQVESTNQHTLCGLDFLGPATINIYYYYYYYQFSFV